MTDVAGRKTPPKTPFTAHVLSWFFRVMAVYCLLFGILYWIRLIGYFDGRLWRFDLMPAHWQIAAVSLAVLYPFAGVGLWNLASWGAVVWLVCAATETAMYAGFPDMFGGRPALVITNVLVVLFYVALSAYRYFERKRGEA